VPERFPTQAEADLIEARKRLMEAANGIKKADCTEVKSLANPPATVGKVMNQFATFFKLDGHKENNWKKGICNVD